MTPRGVRCVDAADGGTSGERITMTTDTDGTSTAAAAAAAPSAAWGGATVVADEGAERLDGRREHEAGNGRERGGASDSGVLQTERSRSPTPRAAVADTCVDVSADDIGPSVLDRGARGDVRELVRESYSAIRDSGLDDNRVVSALLQRDTQQSPGGAAAEERTQASDGAGGSPRLAANARAREKELAARSYLDAVLASRRKRAPPASVSRPQQRGDECNNESLERDARLHAAAVRAGPAARVTWDVDSRGHRVRSAPEWSPGRGGAGAREHCRARAGAGGDDDHRPAACTAERVGAEDDDDDGDGGNNGDDDDDVELVVMSPGTMQLTPIRQRRRLREDLLARARAKQQLTWQRERDNEADEDDDARVGADGARERGARASVDAAERSGRSGAERPHADTATADADDSDDSWAAEDAADATPSTDVAAESGHGERADSNGSENGEDADTARGAFAAQQAEVVTYGRASEVDSHQRWPRHACGEERARAKLLFLDDEAEESSEDEGGGGARGDDADADEYGDSESGAESELRDFILEDDGANAGDDDDDERSSGDIHAMRALHHKLAAADGDDPRARKCAMRGRRGGRAHHLLSAFDQHDDCGEAHASRLADIAHCDESARERAGESHRLHRRRVATGGGGGADREAGERDSVRHARGDHDRARRGTGAQSVPRLAGGGDDDDDADRHDALSSEESESEEEGERRARRRANLAKWRAKQRQRQQREAQRSILERGDARLLGDDHGVDSDAFDERSGGVSVAAVGHAAAATPSSLVNRVAHGADANDEDDGSAEPPPLLTFSAHSRSIWAQAAAAVRGQPAPERQRHLDGTRERRNGGAAAPVSPSAIAKKRRLFMKRRRLPGIGRARDALAPAEAPGAAAVVKRMALGNGARRACSWSRGAGSRAWHRAGGGGGGGAHHPSS